jgi:hypothetical protein
LDGRFSIYGNHDLTQSPRPEPVDSFVLKSASKMRGIVAKWKQGFNLLEQPTICFKIRSVAEVCRAKKASPTV